MINYYLLMKPGIILGNLITVAAGFLLASKGVIYVGLFFGALLGLGLLMGSACVMNNYIDRHLDRKMERTKYRALVTGLITEKAACFFAAALGVFGSMILIFWTNPITFAFALLGYAFYMAYSLGKSHTVYGTAIGSISGAVPPVVGYLAVTAQFDLGALILFAMMVFWQMPHFFAIAIFRMEDYIAAGIPVFPIQYGLEKTRIRMAVYIVGYIFAGTLLTFCGFTGIVCLVVMSVGGLAWLWLCLRGSNDKKWGYQMFRLSLVLITLVSLVISFDAI